MTRTEADQWLYHRPPAVLPEDWQARLALAWEFAMEDHRRTRDEATAATDRKYFSPEALADRKVRLGF